jgi:hypothetical protein
LNQPRLEIIRENLESNIESQGMISHGNTFGQNWIRTEVNMFIRDYNEPEHNRHRRPTETDRIGP